MSNGWEEAAATWISGIEGDFARRFALDAPMLERARLSGARDALDIGCGEGRFSRMLAAQGMRAAGIDPAPSFVAAAKLRHPEGDYRIAEAEHLPFGDAEFDLAVSYLTLIDITDAAAAIREMARVLRPGGRLLIANLNSFYTASPELGWIKHDDGTRHFEFDNYMTERSAWVELGPLTVLNWHRPFSTYLSLLLGAGLVLTHFDEPQPQGGDPARADLFRRVPPFHIMEWQKPA